MRILACQCRANDAERCGKPGERVAWLQEAYSLSNTISQYLSSHTSTPLLKKIFAPSPEKGNFSECKAFIEECRDAYQRAKKDNDLIYNEHVPAQLTRPSPVILARPTERLDNNINLLSSTCKEGEWASVPDWTEHEVQWKSAADSSAATSAAQESVQKLLAAEEPFLKPNSKANDNDSLLGAEQVIRGTLPTLQECWRAVSEARTECSQAVDKLARCCADEDALLSKTCQSPSNTNSNRQTLERYRALMKEAAEADAKLYDAVGQWERTTRALMNLREARAALQALQAKRHPGPGFDSHGEKQASARAIQRIQQALGDLHSSHANNKDTYNDVSHVKEALQVLQANLDQGLSFYTQLQGKLFVTLAECEDAVLARKLQAQFDTPPTPIQSVSNATSNPQPVSPYHPSPSYQANNSAGNNVTNIGQWNPSMGVRYPPTSPSAPQPPRR